MPLLVSIVTPSFQQAAYLEAAIRSVLDQSYPHIEYIVIDGGSTDSSVDIIRKYADRLAHWSSERDAGQADAIAKGFSRASGDILCWLNSDDLLLPGAIERVVEFFEMHPDCDIANGGAVVIDAAGGLIPSGVWLTDRKGHRSHRVTCNFTLGLAATYDRLRYFGQSGVYQPATFWRKAAYDRAGGLSTNYHYLLDLDLFARITKASGAMSVIPGFLAAFRIHAEAKTFRPGELFRAETHFFRAAQQGAECGTSRALLLGHWYKTLYRLGVLTLLVRQKLGCIHLPQISRTRNRE